MSCNSLAALVLEQKLGVKIYIPVLGHRRAFVKLPI